MKIVFVSTLYAPNERGGAERTVRILAETLVTKGHQAVVISLAPDGVAREGMLNGVRTYYVPLANVFWKQSEAARNPAMRMLWHAIDAYNPIMAGRVRKILEREQPDVVQTGNLQGFSVSLWRAVKRLQIPLVQMLHDYYLGCPKSTMAAGAVNCEKQCRMCRVYSTPRRVYSDLPVAVISLSRRMLARLEATGLFAGVQHKFVIHGANNTSPRVTPRLDKAPGTPIVAGYLGRMENTKGIEVLLEAAKLLPANRIKVVLGGTGDDDYVHALQRKYAGGNVAGGNIEFLGFVKPTEFFERIDVLIVPSVWEEPLGRVIYEGYAHGVPALVANVGGMPEIVRVGHTGYVFKSGDSNELAGVLGQMIDDGWPGARFFTACTEYSREFSVDRIFDEYLRVWDLAARSSQAGGLTQLPPASRSMSRSAGGSTGVEST